MICLLFLQTFIMIFIYPNQCTFFLILSYHHMHPLHITIWICLSKMRYLFLEIRSCILSYPMHNHFLIASLSFCRCCQKQKAKTLLPQHIIVEDHLLEKKLPPPVVVLPAPSPQSFSANYGFLSLCSLDPSTQFDEILT